MGINVLYNALLDISNITKIVKNAQMSVLSVKIVLIFAQNVPKVSICIMEDALVNALLIYLFYASILVFLVNSHALPVVF